MQSCKFRATLHNPVYVSRNLRRGVLIRPAAAAEAQPAVKQQLLYDGVALDMDGTLTSCIIDFQDMRKRTGMSRQHWRTVSRCLQARQWHTLKAAAVVMH
jgi:hypothetical protein